MTCPLFSRSEDDIREIVTRTWSAHEAMLDGEGRIDRVLEPVARHLQRIRGHLAGHLQGTCHAELDPLVSMRQELAALRVEHARLRTIEARLEEIARTDPDIVELRTRWHCDALDALLGALDAERERVGVLQALNANEVAR